MLNEIGIIAQLATNTFERRMPEGMTMAQFTVLNHFARLGGERSPNELARAFQVTKGTMTSTLQRVEAHGWITIRPDAKDGRAKRVAITPSGRRARDTAIRALAPALAELATALSDESFEAALPFLTRLRAHLDQARDRTHDRGAAE